MILIPISEVFSTTILYRSGIRSCNNITLFSPLLIFYWFCRLPVNNIPFVHHRMPQQCKNESFPHWLQFIFNKPTKYCCS